MRRRSGGRSSSLRRTHAVSSGRSHPAYGRLGPTGRICMKAEIGTNSTGTTKGSHSSIGGAGGKSGPRSGKDEVRAGLATSDADARIESGALVVGLGGNAPWAGSRDGDGDRSGDGAMKPAGDAANHALFDRRLVAWLG